MAGRSSRSTGSIPSAASSATRESASRRTGTSSRRHFTSASTSPQPDGTAVYATASGRIVWEPERPETIAIRAADGSRLRLLAHRPSGSKRSTRGRVQDAPRPHLQRLGSRAFRRARRRPLREPAPPRRADAVRRHHAADDSHVQLRARTARASGARSWLGDSTWSPRPGTRRLWRVPGKWADKPVMPAVVRWRVRGRRSLASPWQTAIDFSATIPAPSMFDSVYAPLDTAEPCVASGPVPRAARARLGQPFAAERRYIARGRGDRHAGQPTPQVDPVLDGELIESDIRTDRSP